MKMNRHFLRGVQLLQQSRHDLAAEQFRNALAQTPEDPVTHAMMAFCLLVQKEDRKAREEAELAVHLGPDLAYAHYALAYVLEQLGQLEKAKAACDESIRLDPQHADYWARLAIIEARRLNWARALEAADAGLEIDAVHGDCTRVRAVALRSLGRVEESHAVVRSALQQAPDSALTHNMAGWASLRSGDDEQAIEHFREALRLNASLWHARVGIVEAMKARHTLYRWILRFLLWIGFSGGNKRGLVVIGAMTTGLALAFSTGSYREGGLRFYLMALAPTLFILWLACTAESLFNFFLRMDAFGRRTLTREQILSNNWLIGGLGFALISLVVWLATDRLPAGILSLVSATMTAPICILHRMAPGRIRKRMILLAVLLCAAGITAAVAAGYWAAAPRSYEPFFGLSFSAYGIGWWLFILIANGVVMAQLRRS